MTIDVISKMIAYLSKDVRRINHALKVYGFVKAISEVEIINEEKLKILEIAAILHDIGIKESERKYNSSSGKYQEIEGPPIAREVLKDFNQDIKLIDRIS